VTLTPGWRRLFRIPRVGRRGIERDVDDELSFHLAMRVEKLRDRGVPEEIANAEALARFGDASRVRDELLTIDQQFAREARLMDWLDSVRADLRYAIRTLRRSPVFTIVAVLTLAIGIGATSAIFSLVNGILLEPLPYAHPEQLVSFAQSYPEKGLDSWQLSQENLAMYRDGASDFASFAGFARRGVTLGGEHPERLTVERTTGEFFQVLGVAPLLGHTYGNAEDTPRTNSVAVLTYAFWQSHFGGRRDVVGTVLDLDGEPVTVIGVMPRSFAFPRSDTQVYLPLGLDPTRRFGWFLGGVARLAPGVTVEQAHRQTTQIFRRWAADMPQLLPPGIVPERTGLTTLVRPLQSAIVTDVRRPLIVLQAAVLLMLLIAVANVATLQSSRAAGRAREIAVRGALGATRTRVGRQLLTESIVLAILGGVAGAALAWIGVREFTASGIVTLPRLDDVRVDPRVLAFTLLVSLACGVLFGLAPLWHAVGRRATSDIARAQREGSHRGARRVNNVLVVAQLGLSVTLLVAAGLVLESFQHLVRTDLGFDPRGVTAISTPLPMMKYGTNASAVPFTETALRTVRSLPGVRSAAFVQVVPFSGAVNTDGYLIEGHAPPSATGTEKQVVTNVVTPGFFRTLNITLLRGRDFTTADRDGSLPVTIVDETLAREYWPDLNAVGRRMRLTGDTTWLTIVGVARSVRDEDVATPSRPHMYTPIAQQPTTWLTLVVRSDGDATATTDAVRRAIHGIESGIPLDGVRPLTQYVDHALDTRRMTEILLGAFALMAVLLAAVGIYGVMSLYVSNRTREFGIRMAVGAEPSRVVRLVLSEGIALAIVGVVLGVGGALIASRWIGSLLYDVSAHDPLAFTVLPIALGALAVASCVLPARRAAKSDPLVALRAE